jgi:hypothetical protein
MKKLPAALIIILALALAPTLVNAGEPLGTKFAAASQATEDDLLPIYPRDEWQFFVSPYLWIPGVNINTNVAGRTTSIDVPWWDIAGKLFSEAIGAMGRIEVWKGRWGFFLDSYFIYLDGTVSQDAGRSINPGPLPVNRTLVLSGTLKYIVRAGNLDFGLRYLVGTTPLSSDNPLPLLSLEILGGGRWNWYNQDLSLGVASSFTGPVIDRASQRTFTSRIRRSYVEPLLGLRLSLWLTEKAVTTFRGTVGGFGLVADGNLDADLELAFGYRVHKNIYPYLGYRAWFDKFSKATLGFNGWFHGPTLGAVFVF